MTGLIILAAGESSRLGKPKQNLLFQRKTLLLHAITTAINSVCKPVVVILGAYTEIIMPGIGAAPVKIIHNPDWHEGMSTSIRLGITELQKIAGIESIVIMLCDQPFVNTELINDLLNQHQQSRKGIVACAYNDTLGVPVLFQKQYFTELLLLKGHEGAKKLLTTHTDDIASITFPLGAVDIDTMDDYEGLIGR